MVISVRWIASAPVSTTGLAAVPPVVRRLAPAGTIAVEGELRAVVAEDAGPMMEEVAPRDLAELGVVLGEQDVLMPHLVNPFADGRRLGEEGQDDVTLVFTFGIVHLLGREHALVDRVLLDEGHVPHAHSSGTASSL